MRTTDSAVERDSKPKLLPTAAWGATLLRFSLVAYWIVHWWFKVGFRGMPITEKFFVQQGLTCLAGVV